MGFLKRLLRTPPSDQAFDVAPPGSFESLTADQLRAHMAVTWYGAFELTDAVRPDYHLQVIPRQGFRQDRYFEESSGTDIPVLMASATKRILLDLFLDLLEPLGPLVDVILESSHLAGESRSDLYRGQIDLPVLRSILLEHEDLLLNDGCTGIAVVAPERGQEVQLDEHKMLIAYGAPLEDFEQILIRADVYPDPSIRFVTEAEHIHSSHRRFVDDLERLRTRLGMDHAQDGDCRGW